MTVLEALQFNAELRMPKDVTYKKKDQFVQDVIRVLELEPIADAVVGPPGAGLSFEELKRVTIGCEVVANPSLIFLDEPTTGLDGRAALMVVRVMRKLAQTGRAIICKFLCVWCVVWDFRLCVSLPAAAHPSCLFLYLFL